MSVVDTSSPLGALLHEHRDRILEIAAHHRARSVRVFGSVARGDSSETSDIDLLVIDGPPWTINPTVRGRAEVLFERVRVGGMVLLDDAARPGERLVARRWRERWPDFDFRLLPGIKGTLVGERLR